MTEKTTVHLNEYDVREIIIHHLNANGYQVDDVEIIVRGKEGDIQIPKGAIGDRVGVNAKVVKII